MGRSKGRKDVAWGRRTEGVAMVRYESVERVQDSVLG